MSDKERTLAFEVLKKGDFIKARDLLGKLLHGKDPVIERGYVEATEHLLRRYWRQGKHAEFLKAANGNEALSLAIARFEGKESMQKMVESAHCDASLAKCSLEPSLKEALLSLRRLPGHKEMAEGWIALLKKDIAKARASFEAALSLQPQRAKIALAVTDMLEGNTLEEAQVLPAFLKAALNRFPRFAELAGKTKEGQGSILSKEFIYSQRSSTDIRILEKIASGLHASQKEEKGWIYARMGDLKYAETRKRSEALPFWLKAESFHPDLKPDMMKRQFIALYREEMDRCRDFFLEYFHVIYRKDKKMGEELLRRILSECNKGFYRWVPIPFFSEDQNRWLIPDPSLGVVYFALTALCARDDSILDLKMPSECYAGLSFPAEVLRFIPELDVVYKNEEAYWLTKTRLALLLRDPEMKRSALARLMEMNPYSIEENLIEYIPVALQTLASPFILQEVKHLAFLYPSRFELARLLALLGESIEVYSKSFSNSLTAVLHLQISMDKKSKDATRAFKKALSLYGKDQEADVRFWPAVLFCEKPLSGIKKAFMEKVLCHERSSEILIGIMGYQETGFCDELLDYWYKKGARVWQMYFFMGMRVLADKDFELSSIFFCRAIEAMPEQESSRRDRIRSMALFLSKQREDEL